MYFSPAYDVLENNSGVRPPCVTIDKLDPTDNIIT